MQELDDIALLRQYTEQNSEEAFAALVSRHVNKVYSVALRHTRNPHQAEEITQAVFVILANKSRHLGKGVVLSGWLCKTARLTAVTFIRSEVRRVRREQEAHMQTVLNETETDVWPQIAPLLDAAMAGLSEADYHAVVLRFFDGKSMREVGVALGASEDAAKMRLNRAVEKLRGFFTKRGVVLPAAVLTAAISANSVQAAPAVLEKTATAIAFAKGATASASTLTLIKGALKVMAWSKAKTAIVVGVVAILAAGTTTTLVVRHRHQSGGKNSAGQIGTNPGDFAPDKLAMMERMKSIKAAVIPAFIQYAQAHQDEIPKSMSDLQPYLPPNTTGMDDDHWEILASGKLTPQLTQKDVVLLQQKYVPAGQYGNQKIIGYTDGHFTGKK